MNRAQIPFTMLNSYYGDDLINYVGVDDAAIGRMAGEFLFAKGHRRIAFMGGSKNSPVNAELLRGLRAALKSKGVRIDREMLCFSEYDNAAIDDGVRRWFTQKDIPTAIFCADDQVVPEIYEIVRALKKRIPSDVAVLGRGDLSANAYLRPRPSIIAFSIFEMGRKAAELLIDSLDEKSRARERVLLSPQLIEREST
jgi:LacI family transcriptional regulator